MGNLPDAITMEASIPVTMTSSPPTRLASPKRWRLGHGAYPLPAARVPS
jgi:hypothetical protein